MFILKIIILLGALHGIFLGFAVLKKYKKNLSNLFLSLWIFSTSYLLVITFLYLNKIIKTHLNYYMFIEFELFLGVTLFYLYAKFLTDINLKFKKYYMLHFIPAVISSILLIIFIIRQPVFLKRYYQYSFHAFFICTIYLLLSIRLLYKKRKDFYSWMMTRERKIWIVSIILISLISWFISLFIISISFSGNIYNLSRDILHGVIALMLSIEIYLLGYFALVHPVIFIDEIVLEDINNEKNILLNEDTEEEYNKLILFMNEKKIFLDPELCLDELSFHAKIIPPHRLSQIIKKHEGINYCEFLNKYRINEFINLLNDNKNNKKSILELAYDAGFNSKSTFNRVFKDHTGLTPSEYKIKIS